MPLKSSWFAIRRPLEGRRRLAVTIASFAVPLGLWCFFAYAPGPWHRDKVLDITANWAEVTTVYTPGDRLERDFFETYAEAVRDQNANVVAVRESGESQQGGRIVRRENRSVLRQLGPIAETEGWLKSLPRGASGADFRAYDEALYDIWGEIARGEKLPRKRPLSAENLAIIRDNWVLMSEVNDRYDSGRFVSIPLQQLIPQGRVTTPDYLPPPHEVLATGISDFQKQPAPGRPWMHERLLSSLKTVLLGFLAAVVLAVPIGILSGTYDLFSRFFEPFTDFFRYMPAPVFSTLLVATLGVNEAPKIALIFVGTYFQMLLVVANTTRQLDMTLIEASRTLGARGWPLIRTVTIPGILPNLYDDLRILLGWAWTWLVIAELIGVKSGLTEVIDTQGTHRNFDHVYAVIILIGLIGFGTDQILQMLRGIFFPYMVSERGALQRVLEAGRGATQATRSFLTPYVTSEEAASLRRQEEEVAQRSHQPEDKERDKA